MKRIADWIDSKYPAFERLFSDVEVGQESTTLTKVLFRVLSFAAVVTAVLLCIDLLLIFFTEKGGVFGDFFGGVLNPILTFLTLFGLITTIVIQRQELRLARFEYEKTADALGTQAVETTFFNILDLHHKIVDNIKVDLDEIGDRGFAERAVDEIVASVAKFSRRTVFEGRVAFEEILEFISHKAESPDEVLQRYRIIQTQNNHVLGHYFRNLYQALKVIDGYSEDVISKEQKRKYASILRAQLSTKELALLFINCLEGVCDSGQFKNLLIEYSMLEHLPIEEHKNGYSLAGSKAAIASKEMFLQYKEKKNIAIDLNKYYGGAFGQNRGVPYDLRPNCRIPDDHKDA